MNQVMQGLWVGSELSVMEQLSISSFLGNGHEYHLYVYDDLKTIPPGTVRRDASEILPESRIFKYKNKPSYAGFANFFIDSDGADYGDLAAIRALCARYDVEILE